jgi:hypothetical protein
MDTTDRQREQVRSAFEAFLGDLLRAIMINVRAQLVATTPVDTSWARSNWVIQVGTPFEGLIGSREAVDTTTADRSVQAALAYKVTQGLLYLSNNVPYVPKLNHGWSAQAPANFVEGAIDAGIRSTLQGYADAGYQA